MGFIIYEWEYGMIDVKNIIRGNIFNWVFFKYFWFWKVMVCFRMGNWDYLLLKYLDVDENIYWNG